MAEKNICGKIPLELHEKVRHEVERDEITTSEFIRKVIEEHFTEKGEVNMAVRTVAVQVSEELFARLKAVIAWDGRKQKQFLTDVIEQAICEVEKRMKEAGDAQLMIEQEEAEPEDTELGEAEPEDPEEADTEPEEAEPEEAEPENPEEADTEPEEAEPEDPEEADTEPGEAEPEDPEEEGTEPEETEQNDPEKEYAELEDTEPESIDKMQE